MNSLPLVRSAEVAAAQASGRPVVALESTIITHGMPYPQNLEVAREVENDLRAAGATPATIAVINGVLHIGLDDDQLESLAQAKGVAKLSRADIAVCIAAGGTGAMLTVSSTVFRGCRKFITHRTSTINRTRWVVKLNMTLVELRRIPFL